MENNNHRNHRESRRGNRGSQGNRGSRGNHRYNNRDDYYFNQAMNNNYNQNYNNKKDNYKKKHNHGNKRKDNIKNMDDYFNMINNNQNNNNGVNNEEQIKEDYNESENIFKTSQNYNYNKKEEGFNNSSKQMKEIKKKVFISYTQLKELKEKDDNELIQFFTKYKDISEIFGNTKFTNDMVSVVAAVSPKIIFNDRNINKNITCKFRTCFNNIKSNIYKY